jgi:hypothetical protein
VFFRCFTTNASVLWSEFETEVGTIRSTLAAVPDDAYDRWSAQADTDLTVYLDAALTALATGFAPDKVGVGAPSAD